MCFKQAQARYDNAEPDFSAHQLEDAIDEKMVEATGKFADEMSVDDFQDFLGMIDQREIQAMKDALVDGDSLEAGEIIARYFQEHYKVGIRDIAKDLIKE